MHSSLTPGFRKLFAELPKEVRDQARKRFRLWSADPRHPSLHFKKVGEYWSARVDNDYRVLGTLADGRMIWFFIGRHSGYDRQI